MTLFGGSQTGTRGRTGPALYTMLATGVLTYMASHPNALRGLLDKFHNAGEGDAAHSWVGNGPNAPIHPQAVQQALGRQDIEQIAQQSGLSPQETVEGLPHVLPNVVDKLTPHGEVPPPNILQQGINFLKNSLRK
ncbi:MAG TPA: YidB family protein [bacterium]